MALAAVIASLVVTSCSGGMPAESSVAQAAVPTATPSLPSRTPTDALEEKRQEVESSLSGLIAVSKQPNTDQVRSALSNAGISPGATEVTATTTPTGLQADTLQVGVLVGKDCVMANIRGGVLSVTTLPVLSDGRCFVGGNAHG
jgi:hypothetical protein